MKIKSWVALFILRLIKEKRKIYKFINDKFRKILLKAVGLFFTKKEKIVHCRKELTLY